MTRSFLKAAVLASITLLISCGGDVGDTSSRQHALERGEAPSSYMQIPVLTIDSLDQIEGYAFGFSEGDGWHWGRRVDVDPKIVTPLPNGIFEIDSVLGDIGDAPSSAYTFRTQSQAASSFSATFISNPNLSVPTSSIDYNVQSPAASSFSASLGAGSGGTCDLTRLCDIAESFCSGDCGGGINQCRQAVYSIQIPAEVQPYICVIIDYVECILANPESLDFDFSEGGVQANVCLSPFLTAINDETRNNGNVFNNGMGNNGVVF